MGWGREGFSCICSVDDVTLMMFRGGVGILMFMHMFRCQVDDVQRRGGEMFMFKYMFR